MSNDYPNLSEASQQLSQSTAALLTGSEITSADLAKFNTAVTQSKDSLKGLEPGPADSANKANAAMNAADSTWQGAKLRAALVKAATPYPDFWLPLVDSLDLEEGFGQVSFTRSTTATYVDKSGVLKTAGVNTPRFEREGILIEGGSTNLLDYSSDFSKWQVNVQADLKYGITDPMGTKTAVQIKALAGGRGIFANTRKKDDVKTASAWLRADEEGVKIRLGFDEYKEFTLTKEWKRYEYTGGKGRLSITIYPSVACTYYVAFAQAELLPFASSYIPTNGSPVTKSADLLTFSLLNNFTRFNDFSIFLVGSYLGYAENYSGLFRVTGDSKNASSPRIERGSDKTMRFYDRDASGNQLAAYVGKMDDTIEKRLAYVREGNDHRSYMDGNQIDAKNADRGTDTSGIFELGKGYNAHTFCHLRNFRIWHRALTDEQIALL